MLVFQAVRIDMKARLSRYIRIEHRRSHKLAPEKRGPVVGTRGEIVFIEQCVVACVERVVRYNLDAALCQRAELVEVAEAVEKRGCPGVAAACGLSCLGEPDRFAGHEAVAKLRVEGLHFISGGKPLVRERSFRSRGSR